MAQKKSDIIQLTVELLTKKGEAKKLDEVIPYERNNKTHSETQINRIANSIKEFGWTQPIVVDKNNIIIIGHGRLEAAKKLELSEIPVVTAGHLTAEQVKKLRILDNKLNESEWDLENLGLELQSIGDFNIGELELPTSELFPELNAPDFNADDFEDNAFGKHIEANSKLYTMTIAFDISYKDRVETRCREQGKGVLEEKILDLIILPTNEGQ